MRRRFTWSLFLLATLTALIVGTAVLRWSGWLGAQGAPKDETDATFHWREAQQAIASRDFSTAIHHLGRCLESWPVNAEVHFLLAQTSRRAGDFATWKTELNRSAILGWPKEQIELERRLRRAQNGDIWAVEDSLIDELNNQPPQEVLILEALVNGFSANDRLADVLFFTTIWIQRFPRDWLPRTFRGDAIRLLHGGSDDVIRDYENALELNPDHSETRLALAGVLMSNGRFEESISHFQTYLESHPNDPAGAHFGIANCLFSLGQIEEAQATLNQLLARHPEHAPGFFLLGKIELARGSPEGALPWLKKAEAVASSQKEITSTLLQVYRQLGRQKDAEKYQLLTQELRQGDAELDDLVRQIKSEPDNIDLRFQAGLITLKLGRAPEASHWFQSILWKDPHHQPTLNALADYYKKKGDKEEENYYRRLAERKKRVQVGRQ